MLIKQLENLKLDKDGKASVVASLEAVMKADGRIDEREVALIEQISGILGLDKTADKKTGVLPEISDKKMQQNILSLLYLVSYIDESKHEKEEEVIRTLVSHWAFSEDDFAKADKKARMYIMEGFLLKNTHTLLSNAPEVLRIAEQFDLNADEISLVIEDIIVPV